MTGAFASLEPASRPPLPSPVTQYGGIGDRDVDDVMMTVMMLMMVMMMMVGLMMMMICKGFLPHGFRPHSPWKGE